MSVDRRSRRLDRRAAPGRDDSPGHERMLLACVCASTALVVACVASINLAVPLLSAGELHPGPAELLWIVDAYVVVFACLVIPAGAAGDRLGRKGLLLVGLVVFALGSAVSGSAASVFVMLVGRAACGVGAALVLPNALGVLVHATPPARRGRAVAVWAAATGVGGIVGNVGGGALLLTGSWRALFLAVVPLALGCAVWTAVVARPSACTPRGLDPLGTLLLAATTVSLLVGVIEGPEAGWISPLVTTTFAASVALAVLWVVVELRVTDPLLDPRLLLIARLGSASLGMVVTFFGSFGLFFLNASLLQNGFGFSAWQAGLGILPLSVPIIVVARFVPTISGRVGVPATLAVAFLATSGGLLGLSRGAHHGYAAYAPWLLVVGVGIALALPCLTAEITTSLPPERSGLAGGLQAATRELGSALGVAVVGTLLTSHFVSKLPPSIADAGSRPRTFSDSVLAAPAQRAVVVESFVSGASTALAVTALLVLVLGVVVVAGSVRGRVIEVLPDTQPELP